MKKLIIGTLGKSAEDPTCSMLAAHELYKAVELRGFPTFEEAIKELKYKSINKVIVPAAYPNIRNFIMDDNLKVERSFIYDIPDLVLVSKVDLPSYDVIFLHPATQSLLPKISFLYKETVLVDSNSVACERAIMSERACAVTNEACAIAYNLTILRTLRKSIHMPFIIFEENNIL